MSDKKPTTHRGDLTKLPEALGPLVDRKQWCVWRWTQMKNGKWQKPPFIAAEPDRHASSSDPTTWCDYETALATVQAGKADGISYVLTADDPFIAFDLDHCRHPVSHSIDAWAQNFLDTARDSYAEVTPSGEGIRIWGLTAENTASVNRKFTLEINGKEIAAELFRRAPKILTVTGLQIDSIKQLANLDKALGWALTWGERRTALAAEAKAKAKVVTLNGHEFNTAGGSGHDIETIEKIVREGADVIGGNRSNTFHTVVGHYLGCGWTSEQIYDHLRQFPDGIGNKYIGEGRLSKEVDRSVKFFEARKLPLSDGWKPPEKPTTKAPPPSPAEYPELDDGDDPDLDDDPEPEPTPSPKLGPEPAPKPTPDPIEDDDPPELDDDDLDEDDPDEDELQSDLKLPTLHMHGEPDTRPLVEWLIKDLVPKVGHGLLVGQWGTYKTFAGIDMGASVVTGQAFLDHPVKRQCGVMWIAAEGASQIRARLDAVVKEKCGGDRIPFSWYEATPTLLQKGATETLIEMARLADSSLQEEFGVPLGLIFIDTITACAGYTSAGGEYDSATIQALMSVLRAVSIALDCFVFGVHHFGKDQDAGSRGSIVFEDHSDVILACLGERSVSGTVKNTRLAVRKNKGGLQGEQHLFTARVVELPELDEDGKAITSMVIDWKGGGAPGDPAQSPTNPWIVDCPRQDTRTIMLRLQFALTDSLTVKGVELPIPPDGPTVRMVDLAFVREEFNRHTPADGDKKKQQDLRSKQFSRGLARAEQMKLIGIVEIDAVTYLRLTRPEPEPEDDGEEV